jgi:hypothetical protein
MIGHSRADPEEVPGEKMRLPGLYSVSDDRTTRNFPSLLGVIMQ